MGFKVPWSTSSEGSLLDLVREQRFLWNPRDPLYHKNKLRCAAFNGIADALKAEHPELSELTGAQVRMKFKNLWTYFMRAYHEVQRAPSGSGEVIKKKWRLFYSATFLIDSFVEETSTQASFELSSSDMVVLTVGDDSKGTTTTMQHELLNECEEISPTCSSPSQSPVPRCASAPVNVPSSSNAIPSPSSVSIPSPSPNSIPSSRNNSPSEELPPPKKNRKTYSKGISKNEDESMCILGEYLARKGKVSPLASSIGQMVEAAADGMPMDAQLDLMAKIVPVIKDIKSAIASGKYNS